MHAVDLYGVAGAVLVAVRILGVWLLAGQTPFRRWPCVDLWICKYLSYFRLVGRHGWVRPWTGMEVVCLCVYLGAVITGAVLCQESKGGGGSYLGTFLVMNMIPLYVSHTHDLPSQLLGLSLRPYARLHRVVGWVCLGLATTHTCLAWKVARKSQLARNAWVGILLVSAGPTSIRLALTGAWS